MTGWTSNVYPAPLGGKVKVIAFNGALVLHLDKLDPATVDTLDFESVWNGGKPAPVGTLNPAVAELVGVA